MVKPRIFACVLLFLLTFVAVTPMLTVKSAKTEKVASQWGHLYPSGHPQNEEYMEGLICYEIYRNFNNSGWVSLNKYGTYTQLAYVMQVLQHCQYPYSGVTWATAWWVGDFIPDGNEPPVHRGFYGHNSQHIWDRNVYAYANYYWWPPPIGWCQPIPSKQYFAFIWTCANGGLYFDSNGNTWNVDGITYPETDYDEYTEPPYTPYNPFTKYGYIENPYSTPPTAVGMPFGWTGTTGMSTDGYHSPSGSYCYIGWENLAPWMSNPTGYNNKYYLHFPYYFYRYTLGFDNNGVHAPIGESLDYATLRVLGSQYFDSTKLYDGYWEYKDMDGEDYDGWWYCRMRVLGNSNLNLPY